MSKLHFRGEIGISEYTFNVGLSLVEFQEDDITIIYSPALDLSGYGYTESEAKNSFNEALHEFLRYTHNKKTFSSVLKDLGWKAKGKKSPKFSPPLNSDLVQKNELYHEIVNSKNYKSYSQDVELSV